MKFLTTLNIILLFSFNSNAQKVTPKIINGIVLNIKDSSLISETHIINLNSKFGIVSNKLGLFSINASKGDTLRFSNIAYNTVNVVINDYILDKLLPIYIYLTPKTYEIDEFIVNPYKTFNQLKEALVNLEIQDTTHNKINTSI